MSHTALNQGQVARLLMQHRTSLYGYLYACVRNHADAEDVLQNVCVAVMESFDQLRDESGFLPCGARSPGGVSWPIAGSAPARWRSIPKWFRALAEAADRVEERRPASEQQAALMACLETLPPTSRRLIAQRYDGVDAATLASRFGRSVQAVYAQIKRIKTALRSCVEQRLDIADSQESV